MNNTEIKVIRILDGQMGGIWRLEGNTLSNKLGARFNIGTELVTIELVRDEDPETGDLVALVKLKDGSQFQAAMVRGVFEQLQFLIKQSGFDNRRAFGTAGAFAMPTPAQEPATSPRSGEKLSSERSKRPRPKKKNSDSIFVAIIAVISLLALGAMATVFNIRKPTPPTPAPPPPSELSIWTRIPPETAIDHSMVRLQGYSYKDILLGMSFANVEQVCGQNGTKLKKLRLLDQYKGINDQAGLPRIAQYAFQEGNTLGGENYFSTLTFIEKAGCYRLASIKGRVPSQGIDSAQKALGIGYYQKNSSTSRNGTHLIFQLIEASIEERVRAGVDMVNFDHYKGAEVDFIDDDLDNEVENIESAPVESNK